MFKLHKLGRTGFDYLNMKSPRHQLKLQRINIAGRSYSAWRDSRAVATTRKS